MTQFSEHKRRGLLDLFTKSSFRYSTLLQVSKSICILSGNLEAALSLDLDLKRLGFLKEVVSALSMRDSGTYFSFSPRCTYKCKHKNIPKATQK